MLKIFKRNKSDVVEFMGEEPQSDDITMLALKYNGVNAGSLEKLSLNADVKNYSQLASWLDSQINKYGISGETVNKVHLISEENFVNIANYAYPNGEGDAEIFFKNY